MFGRRIKVSFEEFCKPMIAGFIGLDIHVGQKLTSMAEQFDLSSSQVEAIREELDVFRIALLYTFMLKTAEKMKGTPATVARDFPVCLPQVLTDLDYTPEKAESVSGKTADYMDFVSNLSPDQAREKQVYRYLCAHFADRVYGEPTPDTADDQDFTAKHRSAGQIGLSMFATLKPVYDQNARKVVYQD